MKWFSRMRHSAAQVMKAITVTAGAPLRWPTASDQPGGDEWPRPFDYSTAVEAIKINPYHALAVRVKTEASVGLGWSIVDLATDEVLPDQKAAWDACWPGAGFLPSVIRLGYDLETFGNCYIEIAPTPDGPALYHIPAVTMFHKYNGGFRQRTGARQQDFPAWDGTERGVWHLGLYHPEAVAYGQPDWLPALNAILLDARATGWSTAFFENNCVPRWAILVKNQSIAKKTDETIRGFFQSQFQGVGQAHRALLLTDVNDVEFVKLQQDLKDIALTELKQNSRDEVVAAHGVPPRLLGIITSGQLGGGGEMESQLQFFREGFLKQRQALFARWLQPFLPEGMALRFATLDITDPQTDAEYYKGLVEAGVLLPNEARAEMGRPAIDGLDEAAVGRLVG